MKIEIIKIMKDEGFIKSFGIIKNNNKYPNFPNIFLATNNKIFILFY